MRPGGPFPGAPYGPPRRRGGGKVIGFLAGAVVLILVLAVGGYAAYLVRTSHELSTPPVADGLSRDPAAEASSEKLVEKLTSVIYAAATDWAVKGTVSAVYGNGDERVLFVGVNGTHDLNDPQASFNSAVAAEFRDDGQTSYRPETSNPQDACGDGVALITVIHTETRGPTGSTGSSTTLAMWSTRTTFAIVTTIDIGTEIDRHKDLLAKMCDTRADVES
ncbi:hypothetical protein D0T12_24060 [Actinomadura spongiicola]|uniref:Sensor domain-containing protein n=1 Tax=Actinomadura spongiicola TaxID=2303421 RepID=A0A372GCV7_9ACTN|nr:hypothetical protein [Actinomadura spongiicola]RFS83224.1 hypothetical protein D0T12_24060 [Actinomadura spongiicola]